MLSHQEGNVEGMRPRKAMALVLLLGSLGIPTAGEASCGPSKVVVFGHVGPTPGTNANAIKCLAMGEAGGDGRLITPGATDLSMRFAGDFGASTPTLDGRLKGLGLGTIWITLSRERINEGTPFASWVYNSGRVPIPAGVMASGCVTGEIVFNKGKPNETVYDSNRFHTYGSAC